MSGVIVRRLRRAKPDIDRDPGSPQSGVTLPGDFRIGVLDRRHHAFDAGRDDGVCARRRLADMRTGLERHIERGPVRRLTSLRQRNGFGVGTADLAVSSRGRQ